MSATRDKLFDFMNGVLDGDAIVLNAESKVIAIILGVDYNFFTNKRTGSFDNDGFKDALVEQYEHYLDLYKLKGKRFDELDRASRRLILSSFVAGTIELKDDRIIPFCRYPIRINMLGGLYVFGSIIHTCNDDDENKLHTIMMPDNDSIICEIE